MRYIDPEQMAKAYWHRMHRSALKEVEYKLSEFRRASASTVKYWLAVHAELERRAKVNVVERKAK